MVVGHCWDGKSRGAAEDKAREVRRVKGSPCLERSEAKGSPGGEWEVSGGARQVTRQEGKKEGREEEEGKMKWGRCHGALSLLLALLSHSPPVSIPWLDFQGTYVQPGSQAGM